MVIDFSGEGLGGLFVLFGDVFLLLFLVMLWYVIYVNGVCNEDGVICWVIDGKIYMFVVEILLLFFFGKFVFCSVGIVGLYGLIFVCYEEVCGC